MPTVNYSIASTPDDISYGTALGGIYDPNVFTGNATGAGLGFLSGGLRFTGVAVPAGATITVATLTLRAVSQSSATAATKGVWRGIAADDAPAWSGTNPATQTRTTASTSVLSSATDSASLAHNVLTIVQEVLGRGGWTSGNALAFIGDTTGATQYAAFKDYTDSPSLAATLSITYTSGSGGQTLTPAKATSSQTFYAATVTRGSITLTPAKATNSQAFYAPSVSQRLTPSLFINANSFFDPAVARGTVVLAPSLATNAHSFPAAAVTRGAVSLTPPLITNATTFFGPTVAAGSVSLAPALVTNTSTFYGPALGAGAIALAPPLLPSGIAFYGPTVESGAVTLAPSLAANVSTFYPATAAPGTVEISPPLTSSIQIFFGPSVSTGEITLAPPAVANDNHLFAPTVAQASTPAQMLETGLFTNQSIVLGAGVRIVLPVPPARIAEGSTEEERIAQSPAQPSRVVASATEPRIATAQPQSSRLAQTAVTPRRIAS